MKVGFDISQIAHRGGVGVYTDNLVHQLLKNSDLDLTFFYSSLRKPYRGDLPHVKSFKIPPIILEPLLNNFRFFSIDSFIGSVDIFHSSDWIQPKTRAKKVTTYHDVIPLKYPKWSHPKIVEVHKKRLKIVEEEVDLVIAVSESTKKDLLEISKIPEEKIVVIYEGVGEEFHKRDSQEIENFKKKLNLPDKYVLAIGGIGQRRNLARVKKAAQGYDLVITGETIPWLDDKDVPLLFAGAEVLLYPSFYEGFGLPILEGMASGVPVITSKVSAIPEVGGKAVLYVDPEDTKDISNKLFNIMQDKILRNEMIKAGFEQAKKFSWKKCAAETTQIYQMLMNSRNE